MKPREQMRWQPSATFLSIEFIITTTLETSYLSLIHRSKSQTHYTNH